MTRKPLIVVLAALAAGAAIPASSAPEDNGMAAGAGRRVRITYENLTTGQVFSPSAFFSHNRAAPPLFMEGQPAPFGLMRIAEEGNAGPLLSGSIVKTFGGAYGAATQGISVTPGHSRSVELEVTPDHPLITGVFMLVMTNDGFAGVSAVDAYNMRRPVTIDLYAMDAGTENNNERGSDLIAMMGTGRDPENGTVQRHRGLRGDADAPGAWKFDPTRPVGRITIAPTGR